MEMKFTPEEIAESLDVCRKSWTGCTGCVLDEDPDFSDVETFCRCTLEEKAADAIKELLEENKRLREELAAEVARLREVLRWIPVSERNPDRELEEIAAVVNTELYYPGFRCIAMIRGDEYPTILNYADIDGDRVWVDDDSNWYPVTHWKPMPKGPEGTGT